jgi:hypothetical protein
VTKFTPAILGAGQPGRLHDLGQVELIDEGGEQVPQQVDIGRAVKWKEQMNRGVKHQHSDLSSVIRYKPYPQAKTATIRSHKAFDFYRGLIGNVASHPALRKSLLKIDPLSASRKLSP